MNEVFHEDILETFIFCFLASLGIIQIMAARRGWHGLSLYGGRVRTNVNRALGTALLIFAYAWYFSDPLHRNVRNIEALMSMVCLILGILAAAAFSSIAASLSESLRRRVRLGGKWESGGRNPSLREVRLSRGTALLADGGRDRKERGTALVIVSEPGTGNRLLIRRLLRSLPEGTVTVALWTRDFPSPGDDRGNESTDMPLSSLLRELEVREKFSPRGGTFLGLGWGANQLLSALPYLEEYYRPAAVVALAPVVPDRENGLIGDALVSNTPWDILRVVRSEKPWREKSFRSLLRLWAPVCALSVLAATALTVSLHLRWCLLSGPLGGVIASLWPTYYLAARKGKGSPRESWEKRMVSALSRERFFAGACPLTVVLAGDDPRSLSGLHAAEPSSGGINLVVWEKMLRGKFLLHEENLARLVSLLFPGSRPGGA